MEIVKLNLLNDSCEICKLWNAEYGYIYPITKDLFERNMIGADPEACLGAVTNNKIVGFIIGKTWNDKRLNTYLDLCWISLIYVLPEFRKQGIGSTLLKKVEERFKTLGKSVMKLGSDYSPFFPGLPIDLANFRNWFINRGFEVGRQTHDLIRKTENKNKLRIENSDKFTFRIANLKDKDAIISFVERNWPGRWTMETIEYFDNGGDGSEYLICLNAKEEICGFAKVCRPDTKEKYISFSMTWRNRFKALGGIGPLGIDPEYRRHHLGSDLVSSAINHLIDEDASDIIIDWTGLLEFYRHMGFEVWKAYFYASKTIK